MVTNKVFNNNAVATVYPDGREAILVGAGIGFGRRPGDKVNKNKIEKVYFIQNDLQTRFLQLLKNARPDALQAAEEILAHAQSQGLALNNQLILSLTDHICFALERQEQGISLPYLMMTETRMLYPKEFEIGRWSLGKIHQLCGAELPAYEAGYIALQLASAVMSRDEVYSGLKLTNGVTEIIKETYGIELDSDNLDIIRLTTHLKFLSQRISQHAQWKEDADMEDVYRLLLRKHSKHHECITRISDFIRNHFSYDLNRQEKLYLVIHINKLLN